MMEFKTTKAFWGEEDPKHNDFIEEITQDTGSMLAGWVRLAPQSEDLPAFVDEQEEGSPVFIIQNNERIYLESHE